MRTIAIPQIPCNTCRKAINIKHGALFNIQDQYGMCYYCASGNDRPDPITVDVEHFKGNNIEIEFMSGDQDENSYSNYFATMPWTSKGFNSKSYSKKMDAFGLRGIPALVLLNSDGSKAYDN